MATQLARQCARTLSGRHPTAFDGAAADANATAASASDDAASRESGAAACAAARVACSSRQRNAHAASAARYAASLAASAPVSPWTPRTPPVFAPPPRPRRVDPLILSRRRTPAGSAATAATKRSATASAAAEMTSARILRGDRVRPAHRPLGLRHHLEGIGNVRDARGENRTRGGEYPRDVSGAAYSVARAAAVATRAARRHPCASDDAARSASAAAAASPVARYAKPAANARARTIPDARAPTRRRAKASFPPTHGRGKRKTRGGGGGAGEGSG